MSFDARDDRPIFILSSGMRCGSTFLQRLLNSHPDVLIWGETGGTVNTLLQGWADLVAWEVEFRSHRLRYLSGVDGFTSNMCPERSVQDQAARQYALSLWAEPAREFGRSYWGFKEISCSAVTAVRLMGLFPRATVIHLTRDPVDVLISLLRWTKDPRQDIPRTGPVRPGKVKNFQRWALINRSFDALGTGAPWLLPVRYEELVRDPLTALAPLRQRAGLDVDGIDLRVLARRVPDERNQDADGRPPLSRSQLNEEERALLLQPELVRLAARFGYEISFADQVRDLPVT